ncbi:hypothetical protein FPRO06_10987 [Fusarium proliferatum]|nr:hypothetical protein FPRO06_10987 [Fusarium proliferatum]
MVSNPLNLPTIIAALSFIGLGVITSNIRETSEWYLNQNNFLQSDNPKIIQQGIYIENRSGGFLSDLYFIEGKFGQILNAKAYGAKGDGKTDNTAVLKHLFSAAANISAIVYVPFGLWDTYFRVSGAAGTDLTVKNCPKLSGKVNLNCVAASLMLYLTPDSSGYFENVWM